MANVNQREWLTGPGYLWAEAAGTYPPRIDRPTEAGQKLVTGRQIRSHLVGWFMDEG
ncbi:MAG: hypothetical protein OIF55_12725 [Amphritea sp.]|nr:hypothetical protein [Amphritea sp.]